MKKQLFMLTLCATLGLQANDVVVVANNNGHTAFHDAVLATGLYKHAQKNEGEDGSMAPFTIFAPSNQAMKAIASLPDDKKKAMITLHVVPGQRIQSINNIPTDGLPTVGEQMLMREGNQIFIEDSTARATITSPPIEAKNGIVYLIDAVLLPAGMKLPQSKPEPEPVTTAVQPVVQQAPKPAPVTQKTLEQTVSTSPAPAPTLVQAEPQPSQAQMIAAINQLNQTIQQLMILMQQQTQVVYEQVSTPLPTHGMAIPGLQQQTFAPGQPIIIR